MDNNNQTTPAPVNNPPINNAPVNPVPVIPESEMKLPEEQFKDATPPPTKPSSVWTVVLLVLLVVLLGVLTVVVIWGEELIDMVFPVAQVVDPAMDDMAPAPEPTPEEDMAAMESELEDIDLDAMDAELNSIEAELDAEASGNATTTP